MKTFKKVFFYLLLALSILLIALVASVFMFKNQIINQFVREANKHLNTPVNIGKMDVSIFQNFPLLSIVLNDVYVEDSHEGQYPLLTAESVSFQLNPIEVWKGNYTIKGLHISDSETNLKVNGKGVSNYTILKDEKPSSDKSSLRFELSKVVLTNTKVRYADVVSNVELIFKSKDLIASIGSGKSAFDIEGEGEVTTEKISVDGNNFLGGKSFQIKSNLSINTEDKVLSVKPSTLDLKGSGFNVIGEYNWKSKNKIDFKIDGKNTDIQTLLSLLPGQTSKTFEKYQSDGDIYFNAKIKGDVGEGRSPSLSVDFGFKNATIFHPDYKTKIEEASLEGSFATKALSDEREAVLVLKNMNGKLNGEPFTSNFIIQDFKDPDIICDFKGRVDAAAVQAFFPGDNLKNVQGSLLADLSLEGKIELLKNKATAQRVSTRGTIELENINLNYGKDEIPLKNLKGSLQFNNNDLALSNVSAQLGNSDLLFNGFFKNVITFLLFEDQPIGIETDLKSNFLDVDELFAIGFGKSTDSKKPEYEFSISRNINLNFNCDVKSMRYKRFRAHDLKGDLLVKNEMAVSRSINLKTMGGDLTVSGIVDAKNRKAIDVVSTLKLKGIYVDSIFYVFENFDQDFIQDKHLKGQGDADVNLEMTLNQNLKLFSETLVADISAVIKNGELNNFEPMQKLKTYLDDEGLSKLRFSDLKNDIHIEKKTIYIPQMLIRTNVTDIKVSGTHTFDQQIEYHIVSPLRSKKRLNLQEAQSAVEEESGQTKLFLKIVGTTDHYRIVYDTEAVRKKIGTDIKKEVQELKDAFKNKGMKKKKEQELEKDDYFDW
ncbi:MAG TPA: AsmA-like C-terminal region-containing protein [Cyclobacteriaceae bacterium]